jgi:hypothetical protein
MIDARRSFGAVGAPISGGGRPAPALRLIALGRSSVVIFSAIDAVLRPRPSHLKVYKA